MSPRDSNRIMVAISFSIIDGLGNKVHVMSVMICNYVVIKVNKQSCITRNSLSFIPLETVVPNRVAKKPVIIVRQDLN